jgi:hypothetical protein
MEISNLNSPDFFTGIRSIRKAKKYWKKLARENHPKAGGSIEIMQKINYQYFNWQNLNNQNYLGHKWEADISEYIKMLERSFSDMEWLTYIQHPKIVDIITIINENKLKKKKLNFNHRLSKKYLYS